MKLNEKSRFLLYCVFSTLGLYCGVMFFQSLSVVFGLDDPREAGLRIAGFVWAMRLLFAVGAVVSVTVAAGLLVD
jgi:hypothetical protein